MAVQLRRRSFTVEDYHQMARAGILGEDGRGEVAVGDVIEKGATDRSTILRRGWQKVTGRERAAAYDSDNH